MLLFWGIIISHYICIQTIRLNRLIGNLHRNWLHRGGGVGGDEGGSGGRYKIDIAVGLGYISYSAVQIEILYLYRQCVIERPEHLKKGVSLYCKDLKRNGRNLVQNIALEVAGGKTMMTLQVYKYLAKTIFGSDKKEHIFYHNFFCLSLSRFVLVFYFYF